MTVIGAKARISSSLSTTVSRPRASPPPPRTEMFERSSFDPRPLPPRPVSRTQAIERARQLLEGPAVERPRDDGSIVVQDPPYVNDPGEETDRRRLAALTQLHANAQVETQALARLTPEEREQYQETKAALLEPSEDRPNGDPTAALALQMMLLEGRLPGETAVGGDQNLLDGLHTMATQELAAGIDRQALLADTVQEVAVPESIAQRSFGTCAPTAALIQLAMHNPAEYVRLVSGLATPEGEVTTAGGDVLRVEEGALTGDRTRSVSQKLLAPALMELGNGELDYSNEDDVHTDDEGNESIGLSARQVDVVLESLYGKDFAYMNTGNAEEQAAGTEFIDSELESGRDVLVGIDWGDGGHKVIVTGTEERDGETYYRIVNPWGQEELIPVDELESRLRNVNYDPNASYSPSPRMPGSGPY